MPERYWLLFSVSVSQELRPYLYTSASVSNQLELLYAPPNNGFRVASVKVPWPRIGASAGAVFQFDLLLSRRAPWRGNHPQTNEAARRD